MQPHIEKAIQFADTAPESMLGHAIEHLRLLLEESNQASAPGEERSALQIALEAATARSNRKPKTWLGSSAKPGD